MDSFRLYERGFSKDKIFYRHAKPEDALAITQLYDEVYEGGYPIVECLDPDRVRRIICSSEYIWLVALDERDGTIVSTTVSKPEKWNNAIEACRSVTKKEYGGRGIATILYDMSLHASFFLKEGDLSFAFPRTQGMRKIMEIINPPITIVGSDYGMHMVSGQREMHLWSFVFNPFRNLDCVFFPPPDEESRKFLCELRWRVGLDGTLGPYPDEVIVGPGEGELYECSSGRVLYSVFPPSKCAYIHQVLSEGNGGREATIRDFVDSHKDIEHFSFYALSDKIRSLESLRTPSDGFPGFRISAYLPAWFPKDGCRYDCFNLAMRTSSSDVKTFKTLDEICLLHGKFEKL